MKTLFLDIDGVLNSLSRQDDSGELFREIFPEHVKALNRIVRATAAKVVLSSSWRYLIHNGHMTIHGFETMLHTHGFCGSLIDCTRQDKGVDGDESELRWLQIRDWLRANRPASGECQRYCILDDDPDAFGGNLFHGVQTSGSGLTMDDAEMAIAILKD